MHLTPTRPCCISMSATPVSSTVRQVAVGQNKERTRLTHGTWIKDLVAGQHVTAVCALLSTCSSVHLGYKDSRTRIHSMSKHSLSHIPVERDAPRRAICYTALLLTFHAGGPAVYLTYLSFSKPLFLTIIIGELQRVPFLSQFTVRWERRLADEIVAGKPFQERQDIIPEMHFWK